jgi:hypothetical protein
MSISHRNLTDHRPTIPAPDKSPNRLTLGAATQRGWSVPPATTLSGFGHFNGIRA